VAPTLYGDIIIKHAKLILAQLRHASEELLSLQEGITGKITVGTLLAASPVLLPHSIAITRRERPGISITVVEGTNDKLMPMLRVGDLDLVVGRLPEYREREKLMQEALYSEPVPIVARQGHPLSKRAKLTLADLADADWILPPQQTSLRRQIEIAFRKAGAEPPTRAIESLSILANHTLLLESDMVAAMPYQVVDTQSGLCRLPVSIETALGPVGISVREDEELTPAAAYFCSVLRRVASQIAESQLMSR
jgi:DNA-binding transcriptional LysR family regulator